MLKTNLNLLAVILYSACMSGSIAAAQTLFESDVPLPLVLELPAKDLLRQAQNYQAIAIILSGNCTGGRHDR